MILWQRRRCEGDEDSVIVFDDDDDDDGGGDGHDGGDYIKDAMDDGFAMYIGLLG